MDARSWAGVSAVLLPSLPAQVHRRYLDESTIQQQGLDENHAVEADPATARLYSSLVPSGVDPSGSSDPVIGPGSLTANPLGGG
jgi:hypothetical protein